MNASGIAEQLHRQRGLHAEGERQGVEDRERQHAERRAPDDPSQLARRSHRAHAAQRPHQHQQAGAEERRQVHQLEGVEQVDEAHEVVRIDAGTGERDHPRQPQHRRRQINRREPPRQHRRVAPRVRTLGKDQGEVHEQRRQQQQRDHVGPVEEPVHAIEPAGEGEGERAEEGHRQPEEMQRRLIERAARPHGRADQQGEDPHRGEDVIQPAGAARDGRERHLGHLAASLPEQGVRMAVTGARVPLQRQHLGPPVDRVSVEREQDVAGPHAGARRRRVARHLRRHDTGAALDPQHPVLDLVGRRPLHDVGDTHHQQQQRGGDRQNRARPLAPGGRRRGRTGESGGFEHQQSAKWQNSANAIPRRQEPGGA